jgi:hypothetical protein
MIENHPAFLGGQTFFYFVRLAEVREAPPGLAMQFVVG